MSDESSRATSGSPARRGPSRRAFLAGGAIAVVAGAGGGVGAGFLRPVAPEPAPPVPPVELSAALSAERALIASLELALPTAGPRETELTGIRADHRAHAAALVAAIAEASGPLSVPLSPSASARPTPATSHRSPPAAAAPPKPVPTAAQLRAAESTASGAATRRAERMTGRNATLLACIAACEATHAELLR